MIENETLLDLVDMFMNSYGWTYEYANEFVTETPCNIVYGLSTRIQNRVFDCEKRQAFLNAIAVGLAFSGKTEELNKFIDEESESNSEMTEEQIKEVAKARLKTLWMQFGKGTPEEFEEAFEKGKVVL